LLFIKNIKVDPSTAANDGAQSVRVECTVVTALEDTSIQRVELDLSHTLFPCRLEMQPVEGNVLPRTMEGDYSVFLPIRRMMDTGPYRLPIIATDSLGNKQRADASLEVVYRCPEGLSGVGSPNFLEQVGQTARANVSGADRVEFLETGDKAKDTILSLIRSAKRQINLQTYTLGDRGAGRVISDELVKKAGEGVEVNLILNADTQYPTSPLGTLRLKFNRVLAEWTGHAPVKTPEPESPAQSTAESPRPAESRQGMSVVLFSGRKPAGPEEDNKDFTEHWLSRLVASKAGKDETLPSWLSSFQGPGGLPALPLLDFAIHEKILVVDGERAVVGGRNMEEVYFSGWTDLDLYLEGPVVAEVQKGFLRSFREMAEAEPTSRNPSDVFGDFGQAQGPSCLFVQSRPWNREYGTLLSLVQAIQSCKKNFYVSSQYIVLPQGLLLDALLDAAKRGVDVRVFTNSARTAQQVNLGAGYYLSLNYVKTLLDAGVRVWEYKGFPGEEDRQPYLHCKEFLMDGELAAVGSFNLSLRSCYVESENLVFVQDQDLAAARQRRFVSRLETMGREITPERLEQLYAEHKIKIEWARHLELLY